MSSGGARPSTPASRIFTIGGSSRSPAGWKVSGIRGSGKTSWSWRERTRLESRRADRKSTRLNSSHTVISYAVFCLKKKKKCSSKLITSILSFITGRLATKPNQIKLLIRNDRDPKRQRTYKKSVTSFSQITRNKTTY